MSARNISASVRDRLLNKARAEKLDYNLLLTRYALEIVKLVVAYAAGGSHDYPWRAGAGWQMP
jgi:hypothetical protein